MGERRGAYMVLVGKSGGRDQGGFSGSGMGAWTGLIWLRTGMGNRHL